MHVFSKKVKKVVELRLVSPFNVSSFTYINNHSPVNISSILGEKFLLGSLELMGIHSKCEPTYSHHTYRKSIVYPIKLQQ